MKIDAQITVIATYEDSIRISVYDKASGKSFLEMDLTREQFVNAVLNRLGNTDVKSAEVFHLDLVGKTMEIERLEFEITVWHDKQSAIKIAQEICPEGFTPDLSFDTNTSFYDKNGKYYARTTARRWV
jgi:hypothetical protein